MHAYTRHEERQMGIRDKKKPNSRLLLMSRIQQPRRSKSPAHLVDTWGRNQSSHIRINIRIHTIEMGRIQIRHQQGNNLLRYIEESK